MKIVDFSTQAEARAFYDSPAWRKLRAQHLRLHPRCCQCGQRTAKGMTVDHKQPRRLVPERALDPANLQTVCRPCHDGWKRHLENDDRHPMGGGIGPDGFPVAARHPWNGAEHGAGGGGASSADARSPAAPSRIFARVKICPAAANITPSGKRVIP
jgi:hypothetical protein